MQIRAILVYLDNTSRAAESIRFAASVARAHGAHLVGAVFSALSSLDPHGASAAETGSLQAQSWPPPNQQIASRLQLFSSIAQESGVTSDALLIREMPETGLVRLSRFYDLVVMSRLESTALASQVGEQLSDGVLVRAACPIVIVPPGADVSAPHSRILVGWDGSTTSARALCAAIPLLRLATDIHMVSCYPRSDPATTLCDQEMQQLRNKLQLHDIRLHSSVYDIDIDAGHALLEIAETEATDLIVVGCYGHSRFREMLLGGVTRTIVRAAKLPVFLAH